MGFFIDIICINIIYKFTVFRHKQAQMSLTESLSLKEDELNVLGIYKYTYSDGGVVDWRQFIPVYTGDVIIVFDNETNQYYSLVLSMTEGGDQIKHIKCDDGKVKGQYYCKTQGHLEVNTVSIDELEKIEYVPKSPITLPKSILTGHDYDGDFFKFSSVGQDENYPEGGYDIIESFLTQKT